MQQKKKPRAKYLFTQKLVEVLEKLLPEKKGYLVVRQGDFTTGMTLPTLAEMLLIKQAK